MKKWGEKDNYYSNVGQTYCQRCEIGLVHPALLPFNYQGQHNISMENSSYTVHEDCLPPFESYCTKSWEVGTFC